MARNPFDDDGQDTNVLDEMYGGLEGADAGRIVARPKAIDSIWPDLRQPRRAIPMTVRGTWDGNPADVPDVLRHFVEVAGREFRPVDPEAVLAGREAMEVPEDKSGYPIYTALAKIVSLAASIDNEGLTNPITVARVNNRLQLETGERRWLAFNMLAMYVDVEQYGRIPAREVEYDPFRQASENYSRDGVNAIGTARQVALLIMNLIDHQHDYDEYEDMVYPGENDRKYYAQVANGYVHSVPAGLRDKITKAMGGLSWNTISQYRSLLALTGDDKVDDAIWLMGSEYDWSERAMRDLKVAREWGEDFTQDYLFTLQTVIDRDEWGLSDLEAVKSEFVESFAMAKLQKEEESERNQADTGRFAGESAGNGDSQSEPEPDYDKRKYWDKTMLLYGDDGQPVAACIGHEMRSPDTVAVIFSDGTHAVVPVDRVEIDPDALETMARIQQQQIPGSGGMTSDKRDSVRSFDTPSAGASASPAHPAVSPRPEPEPEPVPRQPDSQSSGYSERAVTADSAYLMRCIGQLASGCQMTDANAKIRQMAYKLKQDNVDTMRRTGELENYLETRFSMIETVLREARDRLEREFIRIAEGD